MATRRLPLCYRLLMRTCPAGFRDEYEDDLVRTVLALRDAPARHRPILLFWMWECWALYRTSMRVRAQERRRRTTHQPYRPPGIATMIDSILRDVRVGLRTLSRRPTFAAAAIMTLGLGIGASTAVFSVLEGIVLRPLAYPESDRLVMIRGRWVQRDIVKAPVTIGDVVDIRAYDEIFDGVAAFWHQSANLTIDGEPFRVRLTQVTDNFFDVLGMPVFGPGIDAGATEGVVFQRAFWVGRLGREPGAVEGAVGLFGNTQPVLGVTTVDDKLYLPNYQGGPSDDTDVFSVLRINEENPDRTTEWLRVFARLRPGVTMEAAQAAMDALAARQREQYPRRAEVGLEFDVATVQSQVVDLIRPTLLALFASVGLVVLIACANVASLLLMRATHRTREFAVRRALGSGRSRLTAQLVTEHLLLAVLGGAVGIAVAAAGIRALHVLQPANLPRLENVGLNAVVLVFVSVLVLGTTLAFGVWPAVRAARGDMFGALRSGVGNASASPRVGRALVATEVALSVLLLVGTGLMVRTVWQLQRQDPGFQPTDAVKVSVSMSTQNLRAFEERLRSLPGVTAVGSSHLVPLAGGQAVGAYATTEDKAGAPDNADVDFRFVTPDYFAAIGTPRIRGAVLEWRDFGRAVIIDERLADEAWPDTDPVGQHVWYTNPGGGTGDGVVVGVVGHMRHEGLREDGRGTIFGLLHPEAQSWPVHVVIRASGPTDALASSIRAALREIDPGVPMNDITPLTTLVREEIAPTRFAFLLLAAFAAIAVVLAAVGLYGVLAFAVSQRRREIGVRMAFGADARRLRWSIVRQGVGAAAVGLAVGIGGALVLARTVEGFVYGVAPTDPITYVVVSGVLLAIATLASLIPARQATTVDPTTALRSE